jgi:hypothetical protein
MKNILLSTMLLFHFWSFYPSGCFAQNAEPEMRVYPSWQQPRFAFRTMGTAFCDNSLLLAKNSNGILRIYNFKSANDCLVLGGSGARTLDRVFDLTASCLPNGNCNAPANTIEWYFIKGVFTPLCVADPIPCLPETGSSIGPWTFQSVGKSPVFPLPLNETFLSDISSAGNVPLEVSFRNFTGASVLDSNQVLYSQLFFTLRTGDQYIGSALVTSTPSSAATDDFFFEGPIYRDRSRSGIRTIPPTSFNTFSLGPDSVSVQLDTNSPVVLSVSRGANFPEFSFGVRKRPIYPWDYQGVYDLLDSTLPMRQLKIEKCAPNSLQAEYACDLAFDNGTMGQLTISTQKTLIIHYQDCFHYKTIELAPDGAGYSDWYAIDNGADPYIGTANALKRGQMRVKRIARRREGSSSLSVGPELVCGGKPRTICRFNEIPVECQ